MANIEQKELGKKSSGGKYKYTENEPKIKHKYPTVKYILPIC